MLLFHRANAATVKDAPSVAPPRCPIWQYTCTSDLNALYPRVCILLMQTAAAVLAVLDAVLAGSAAAPGPVGFCLVRPPGHHVLPNRPMGFGLLNFMAVAARHAQQQRDVPVHKVNLQPAQVQLVHRQLLVWEVQQTNYLQWSE